jgi:hypothetical protein
MDREILDALVHRLRQAVALSTRGIAPNGAPRLERGRAAVA